MNQPINRLSAENIIIRRCSMQNRFKSWALWVSVAGALWVIASAFGLTEKIGIKEETFKTILDAIGTILIGFGIVNNPTDKEGI